MNDLEYQTLISQYCDSPLCERTFRILSLAYRLSYQYENEYLLLDRAKALLHETVYFQERDQWHKLDEVDKYFPAPQVKNPQKLNGSSFNLDNLIIVTGGDSAFFSWIVETIESVRNGGQYQSVTIGVLDCGLEEKQKEYLHNKFSNIIIKRLGYDFADPELLSRSWKCGIPEESSSAFKAITSRAYIDFHFPGYSYYFWLDADAWVQDESVILDYVSLAQEQGIGVSENNRSLFCSETMFYSPNYMTIEMLDLLAGEKLATCAGVVCLTPSFLEKWRVEVECLYQEKGIVNNSPSLFYAIHKFIEKPRFLPHSHQFFFHREGVPLIDEEGYLFGARSGSRCGIIHLNGFYGIREKYRWFPTRHLHDTIDVDEHIQISRNLIQDCQANLGTNPLTRAVFDNQTQFSFRFKGQSKLNRYELINELRLLLS